MDKHTNPYHKWDFRWFQISWDFLPSWWLKSFQKDEVFHVHLGDFQVVRIFTILWEKRNPIWFLHSPMFDSTTKLNKTSKYADFGVITSSLHSQAFMFSTTKSLPTSKRLFFSTCASLIAEWPPLSLLGWVILYWHEIQLFSLNDFQQERET